MSNIHSTKCFSFDNDEYHIVVSLTNNGNLKVKCTYTKTSEEWIGLVDGLLTINKTNSMHPNTAYKLISEWIDNKKKTYEGCIIQLTEVVSDGSLYLTVIHSQITDQKQLVDMYRLNLVSAKENKELDNKKNLEERIIILENDIKILKLNLIFLYI